MTPVLDRISSTQITKSASGEGDGVRSVARTQLGMKHRVEHGQYSSAKVHRLLNVRVKEGVGEPKSIEDYSIALGELSGLKCEVIDGE